MATVFPRIVSFRGNYSFLNLVTVHKSAETIQGRKLFAEILYSEFRDNIFSDQGLES